MPRQPKEDRTANGLRTILFDEIKSLRAGESDTKQANAVAALAGQICETSKVELAYRREERKLSEGGTPKLAKLPDPLSAM